MPNATRAKPAHVRKTVRLETLPDLIPLLPINPREDCAEIELLCARTAALVENVETTGWLPHTTRAALTGQRKKSHAIRSSWRDGVSV